MTQISVPDSFWSQLQDRYLNDPNLSESWQVEEPPLRQIIPDVLKSLPDNYQLEAPLGVGGSGVVAVVVDQNLNAKRALKISRPSPGKEQLLAKVLQSESDSLRRLSHQNLIRIFAQGVVNYREKPCPYYVMDFVEGVQDSDRYLAQRGRTQEEVFGVFQGVLDAIEYLHGQNTIHMDIKPGNILVTPGGVPILSDLGFAKQLRFEQTYTLIGGTEGYLHPDARRLVHDAKSDPNRLRGDAHRADLKHTWDLYSLGKTFLVLLRELDKTNSKVLSPYARRYLKLLACRLLDGQNSQDERASGISLATFREIKYATASQAKMDLQKLTGAYNLEARIPELNVHVQDSILATTLAVTPFTDRVRDVLNTPAMLRLGAFSQLGLLNLVYPSAVHTRLEHSLGTFAILTRYILALYSDPLNPLFCQLMDEADLRSVLLEAVSKRKKC